MKVKDLKLSKAQRRAIAVQYIAESILQDRTEEMWDVSQDKGCFDGKRVLCIYTDRLDEAIWWPLSSDAIAEASKLARQRKMADCVITDRD